MGDVELAGHHRRDPAGILRDDLDDQLLELHRALVLVHRRAPFVGIVALQHDLGARLPALETPRSGAVGALDAVVLAQRFHAFLVVDHVGEHGELQQQLGERLLEFVLDGIGIGRAQFLDVAGAPGKRSLDRGVLQPLEAVDHVLGREFLAAAERHVVAQFEGVGLAVLADRPRLGEIRDRRAAVPVERHQRVLEHVDDVGGRPPGRALRVVVRRVDTLHHVERLRRSGARDANCQCHTENGSDHVCSLGSRTSRKASPRRLAASTITKIAQLGIGRDVGRHEQEVAALRRHHAEFGGRRLRAHAEEAERRADQDDLAKAKGEEHEDRRNAVQRQVAPDQRAVRHADRAAGFHEFLAHDADRGASRHPRDVGHGGNHQRNDHGGQAAPKIAATASPIRIAGKASITSTSRMIQPSSRR